MITRKQKIFIGSSSEGIEVARALQAKLFDEFEPHLWSDGTVFRPNETSIESLLRSLVVYDFAVLIVTPDDTTISRKKQSTIPRDNVIYELGLFTGKMGRKKVFCFSTEIGDRRPKLPSDLLGVNNVMFKWSGTDSTLAAEIGAPASLVRNSIRSVGGESRIENLPSTALAIGYFKNFVLPVCEELMKISSIQIDGENVDISEDQFDFNIVLPSNLSPASHGGLAKMRKSKKLHGVNLETHSRQFPFFAEFIKEKGRVIFYDTPTTLRVSRESIALVLDQGLIGSTDDSKSLEARELNNFERTIRHLLNDPEAHEFRDNVRILAAV